MQLKAAILVILLFLFAPFKDKPRPASIQWEEGKPGCTFSRGEDGKYRYGIWTDDLGLTIAIDSQELQKSRRRLEPFIGIFLDFTYRGNSAIDVSTNAMNLEFLSHARVTHQALDPGDFSERYAQLAESAATLNQHEMEKHPEKKEMLQTRIDATEQELAAVQEFLGSQCLKPAQLTREAPRAQGWVLFRAKDKWIGNWKQEEELVLRVPLQGRIFEFPFRLPPTAGDLILRKRD